MNSWTEFKKIDSTKISLLTQMTFEREMFKCQNFTYESSCKQYLNFCDFQIVQNKEFLIQNDAYKNQGRIFKILLYLNNQQTNYDKTTTDAILMV